MKLTEEDAGRLLRAGAEGEETYRDAVEQLSPALSDYIDRLCKYKNETLFAASRLETSDVAQEVLLRLLRRPPEPAPEGRALPRLLAWIKTVTYRFLVDRQRKLGRRIEIIDARGDATDSSSVIGDTAEGRAEPDEARALSATQDVEGLRALLRHCQPICLPLFELMLEGDDLPSATLAERLGTSRANVDTLKKRMRVTRKVWLALEETPELTLQELAERVERPANAELKRAQRSVSNYLSVTSGARSKG